MLGKYILLLLYKITNCHNATVCKGQIQSGLHGNMRFSSLSSSHGVSWTLRDGTVILIWEGGHLPCSPFA